MSRSRCFDTGQQERYASDKTALKASQTIYGGIRADVGASVWENTREIQVNTVSGTLTSVGSMELMGRITRGYYDYRQQCQNQCYGSEEAAGDVFNKTLTTDGKDATLDLTGSSYTSASNRATATMRTYPFTTSATACENYVYPPYEEVSSGEATIRRKPIYKQPTEITFS